MGNPDALLPAVRAGIGRWTGRRLGIGQAAALPGSGARSLFAIGARAGVLHLRRHQRCWRQRLPGDLSHRSDDRQPARTSPYAHSSRPRRAGLAEPDRAVSGAGPAGHPVGDDRLCGTERHPGRGTDRAGTSRRGDGFIGAVLQFPMAGDRFHFLGRAARGRSHRAGDLPGHQRCRERHALFQRGVLRRPDLAAAAGLDTGAGRPLDAGGAAGNHDARSARAAGRAAGKRLRDVRLQGRERIPR